MSELAWFMIKGEMGFLKDEKLGWKWLKKSADAKHPEGMAGAGWCLVYGKGVEMNERHGLGLIGAAAGMHSGFGCYFMGDFYFHGACGFPMDKSEAKCWLDKAIENGSRNTVQIQKMLEEIGNQEA